MKNFFTLSIMLCVALIANAQAWDGATKTEVTPSDGIYHITNGAELAWIAEQSNAAVIDWNIVLDNDIDLGGKKWTPIGLNNYFNGNFDGQGHTISNIYLNPVAADLCCGLIGQMNSTSATVKNFTLTGKLKLTKKYSGSNADYASVVGLCNALGSMENVHSYVDIDATASVKCANYLGGLSARVKAVNFIQCSYSGTITIGAGTSFGKGWGGMIATFNTGTAGAAASMKGCWFDGSITSASTSVATYGAAFIGYAKVPTLAMDANYCVGQFSAETAPTSFGVFISNKDSGTQLVCKGENVSGVKSTNYSFADYTVTKYEGTKFTTEEYHDGTLAYTLNYKSGQNFFGQDLTNANSAPIVLNDGVNNVYKTYWWAKENTNLGEDNQYAFYYCNPIVKFPTAPKRTGATFVKWVDKNNEELSVISKNTTFYAMFKQDVTVTGAGAATLFLTNYATTIPENVKVYACSVNDNVLVKDEITEVIPGETPVLIEAGEGTYSFYEVYGTGTYSGTNELQGTTEEPTTIAFDVATPKYVLQSFEGKAAFVKIDKDAQLHANRAYLMPQSVNAKEDYIFINDEPTGIEEDQGSKFKVQGPAYNLNGMRVNGNYNGIVIINGKKHIK